MPGSKTRERILDTAEELFADQGISGTSLRALTRAADVNLAAVHYHFGSKEGLLDAVVERRGGPINRQRIDALDQLEAVDAPATVEAILEAFLMAGVEQYREMPEMTQRLSRLVARIDAQPAEVTEPLYRKHFGDVSRRFVEALQRTLPHLPKETVAERYRFVVGILSFVSSGNFELDVIPGHPVMPMSPDRIEERIAQMIAFLAAGLSAPPADTSASTRPLTPK
jgi:AcrR family transcriptional regulator